MGVWIPCMNCGERYSPTWPWYVCETCGYRICPHCLSKVGFRSNQGTVLVIISHPNNLAV